MGQPLHCPISLVEQINAAAGFIQSITACAAGEETMTKERVADKFRHDSISSLQNVYPDLERGCGTPHLLAGDCADTKQVNPSVVLIEDLERTIVIIIHPSCALRRH